MRLITMSIRSLRYRLGRTMLCLAGIALAVMSIVTVTSVISQYTEVIKDMNTFFSQDLVVVSRGTYVIEAFPLGGSMPENVLDNLAVEGVESIVPMLFIINPTELEGVVQLIPANITFGVPAGQWSSLVGSTVLKEGSRWPQNDSAKEIVIGSSLTDNTNLTVGSIVRIKAYDLRISGILENSPSTLSRAIIIPLKTAQEIYSYEMLVNMFIVRTQQNLAQEVIANKIETNMPTVKALTQSERGETIAPLLNEVMLWNTGIETVLFLISIMLAAAVTMMNISEERKDIATLHAIGASQRLIFGLILSETAFLGLIAGVIGIILGSFGALATTSYYIRVPLWLMVTNIFNVVSPITMLQALILATIVSCIGGVIPAIIAMKTNIAETVRAEY